MKKYVCILIACLSLTLISCNPKTEKAVEKVYKGFKKAPKKGELIRTIYDNVKEEKKAHVEKRICSKCNGVGIIYYTDYYGNRLASTCSLCVGTGYVNVIVEE